MIFLDNGLFLNYIIIPYFYRFSQLNFVQSFYLIFKAIADFYQLFLKTAKQIWPHLVTNKHRKEKPAVVAERFRACVKFK